ncbi:YbjQ family protein [Mollicutes bacterium LVI A0039]|nr:YbjQ family protein [Mollicutes bacterium LVI A0039]
MQIVTTEQIVGHEIGEVLGLVKGSSVRAKNIGRDFTAGLKNIVGGEIEGYRELQDESRKMAMSRMLAEAEGIGADAIVSMRITSSAISQGVSEILVYGTAVKFK